MINIYMDIHSEIIDTEKLFNILTDNRVKITELNCVSLDDFTRKIICPKKPKSYMEDIEDKNLIDGDYCITPDECYDLLQKNTSKKCIRIMNNDFFNVVDVFVSSLN